MNFDIQICSFASNQKFQNHFFNSVRFKVQNSFSFINANRFFYFRQTKRGGWKFALLSNNRLPNTRRIKESETTLFLKLGILTITKPVLLSCAHFFVMKQTAKGRSRAIKSTRSFKEKKKKKEANPPDLDGAMDAGFVTALESSFQNCTPFSFTFLRLRNGYARKPLTYDRDRDRDPEQYLKTNSWPRGSLSY